LVSDDRGATLIMAYAPPERTGPEPFDLSRYRLALTRFFRRRAHPADVDDLVQDVLLRMHTRQSGDEIQNMEGYLFTVAARTLAQHSQRNRRLGWSTDDDPADVSPEEISAERILIGRQNLSQAVDIIERLQPRTREVFVLHRFEEMTYPAIAAALGVSVSAVEKHIMIALKTLAAGLKETR
jgi:RNA polymerase sigma factor (sigma-70 family)